MFSAAFVLGLLAGMVVSMLLIVLLLRRGQSKFLAIAEKTAETVHASLGNTGDVIVALSQRVAALEALTAKILIHDIPLDDEVSRFNKEFPSKNVEEEGE